MISFKQFLTEAPIPDEWDKEVFTPKTSFAKQLKYCIERSKKLGSGSSRVAFEIEYQGRPTVLKIAKNKKGLAQNAKEGDYGLYRMYPDITIPLIDYDEAHDEPLWVHFEKANKMTKADFYKMTKMNFDTFTGMVVINEMERNGTRRYTPPNDDESRFIAESELFYDVTSLLGNFDILANDLTRLENWGTYQNKPVIIDLGFSSDVMKQHYQRPVVNGYPKRHIW
jgi:hypothetical protein